VKYLRVDSDILLIEVDTLRVIEFVASIADLQDPNWPVVAEADRLALVSYFQDDYAHGSCRSRAHRSRLRDAAAVGDRRAARSAGCTRAIAGPAGGALKPLPDGYRYVRVADHVLVMVVATRVIRADVLDLADLSGFNPRRRP
jgi:hypothetical protein